MAIVSCKLVADSVTYGINGQNTGTLIYDVDCDSRMTAGAVGLLASGASPDPIPVPLTFIGGIGYVNSVRVERVKDTNASKYRVTVDIGPPPANTDPENNGDPGLTNPLLRKVVFWCEDIAESHTLEEDRFGVALANSAKQKFDIPPTEERIYDVIAFRKNYASFTDVMAENRAFRRTVNSDTILGETAGTCKFLSLTTGEPNWENGVKYYSAVGRIAIKPEGWLLKLVDRGYKVVENGKLVDAKDEEGQISNEPVNLDTDGSQLPFGTPGKFKEFEILTPKSYANLIADP